MSAGETFLGRSRIYDPLALLRRDGEILVVARVGGAASKRYMIMTPAGDPAWPHEPLGSLSDVGWSLRAHDWHLAAIEATGEAPGPAKTLARLLSGRA